MTPDHAVTLADRQAALVAALVADGPLPPRFDRDRVRATVDALLRKRAGEVGERWPTLRAQFGPEWTVTFSRYASGKPPHGSLRDGWDLARELAGRGELAAPARLDLAIMEASYRYDGQSPPRLRRLPAIRRAPGTLVCQMAGRILRLGRP